MKPLRRLLRPIWFLLLLFGSVFLAVVGYVLRQMSRPVRQRLWATPLDAGIEYEGVEFPARDGLRLSGWFLPGTGEGKLPTIMLVHGWTWNRLGEAGDTLLANLTGALPVDLLKLAHGLGRSGYHVLMFDLRNHGESADGGPVVTFGLQESNDVLGAIDFLRRREEVDPDRIAAVGFSMGANAILYAATHTDALRAAVLVQPTSPTLFGRRMAEDILGPFGGTAFALIQAGYEQIGHLPLSSVEPLLATAGLKEMPILYIQGKGDPWGSITNVAQMADRTPRGQGPLFLDTHHRHEGYRHVTDHPEIIMEFLNEVST